MSSFFGLLGKDTTPAPTTTTTTETNSNDDDKIETTTTQSSPSTLKSLYKSAKRAAGIPSKKNGIKGATVKEQLEIDQHEEDTTAFDTTDMEDALPTAHDHDHHDDDGDDEDTSPDAFTEAEIQAARDTKALLLSDKYRMKPDEVTGRELMITVLTCKCRVDQAAEKYKKWTDVCREGVGLATLRSAFDGVGDNAENIKGTGIEASCTRVFWCAGRDMKGSLFVSIFAICTISSPTLPVSVVHGQHGRILRTIHPHFTSPHLISSYLTFPMASFLHLISPHLASPHFPLTPQTAQ
jgi:hypothetical protein